MKWIGAMKLIIFFEDNSCANKKNKIIFMNKKLYDWIIHSYYLIFFW